MEIEEKPKSRLPNILLALFSAVGVTFVAVVGYLGYTGWHAFRDQTLTALEANPVIRENLGEIESLEFDLRKSAEFDVENTFVLRIRGSLGEGEVTAALGMQDERVEELIDGELRLADGRVLSLIPEEPLIPEEGRTEAPVGGVNEMTPGRP